MSNHLVCLRWCGFEARSGLRPDRRPMLTPAGESDTATATLGIGAALVTIARCAGLPAIGALPWTGTAIFTRRQRRGQCVDRCDER